MKFPPYRFNEHAFEAVTASMQAIRTSFEDRSALDVQVKDFDKTLVTILDHESEAACVPILQRYFPNVAILREEGGLSAGSADWIIWIDPLDGTTARTLDLPTSTVIIAAYSFTEKRLKAVCIGEPAYQRIWQADDEVRFCPSSWPTNVAEPKSVEPCRVWRGDLSGQASVFVDVSHPFQRIIAGRTKPILEVKNLQKLFAKLIPLCKIQIPGSNGLNHALVANGGQYAAGAITTAMGGPWDVAGVLLVLQAGGSARAFNLGHDRVLREADPLDPLAYDIVISGNNQRTVDTLSEILSAAVRA